jgi:hypothetical protein
LEKGSGGVDLDVTDRRMDEPARSRPTMEVSMSNYVLSFRGAPDRTVSAGEEAAWGQWFQEIGGSVADFGHRVGRVSSLGSGGTDRSSQSVLTGYVVITAEDLETAVAVAKGCPGLQHGGSVEVGETVDMS